MHRNPTSEEAMEIGLLSFRINYWLFVCGAFVGGALQCGGLMLLAGMYVPGLAFMGVLNLMAALALHQYRGSLKNKLQKLINDINGVKDEIL